MEENKELVTDLEHSFNEEPMCPHCDYSWGCDSDLMRGHGDGDEIKTYCPSCGKDMIVVPCISITYTTYKPDASLPGP